MYICTYSIYIYMYLYHNIAINVMCLICFDCVHYLSIDPCGLTFQFRLAAWPVGAERGDAFGPDDLGQDVFEPPVTRRSSGAFEIGPVCLKIWYIPNEIAI